MSDDPQASDVQAGTTLDYDAALRLVMGLADFERSSHSPGHSGFHLERMKLLMERLGNAHQDVPAVHIAGTKGKGSTAAMVTSMLAAHGYRVGLYTSPHLHSAVERIRVGLEPISQQDFASLAQRVWPAVAQVGRDGGYGDATTFEMLTAMALTHFSSIGADFQVLEVGLGGRLDSTNIVTPEVCAITSISLDHVATLGGTVELIAREKAGIIKPGVPVVVAPQTAEASAVVRERAGSVGAPIIEVGNALSWRKGTSDLSGQSFQLTGELEGLGGARELWTPLLGDYQLENAATAVAAVTTLMERTGRSLSPEAVAAGLRDVKWPARLEVITRDGREVVVDGAHNPFSMRRLVQAVHDYFDFQRVIVIFGALSGHSARGMLGELAELSPLVVAARSRHPRSAPSDAVASAAEDHGLTCAFKSEDVGEATRRALDLAGDQDLVLGTGSLSVAAEVIEELRGVEPELYPYIKPPQWRRAPTEDR